VRSALGELVAPDNGLTTVPADVIGNDDIHAACLAVAAADLSEEKGSALFKAALTAIRSAERRQL
jgi:hypothetical protein